MLVGNGLKRNHIEEPGPIALAVVEAEARLIAQEKGWFGTITDEGLYDPWGGRVLIRKSAGKYEIWSAGPNRIDDGGTGDDDRFALDLNIVE
jgi:hypothetical protein